MQSEKRDWRQDLPEDWTVDWRGEDGVERSIPLREHPALAKYASKDEAVKALAHAQRLLGRRDQAPGGRPDKPEDYEFPDLPLDQDFEPDPDVLAAFRSQAYDLGLSAEQAAGLYAWFLPLNMRAAAELRDRTRAVREDELARLRQEHGGQASRVLEAARQAAMSLGGEELLEVLDQTGAADRAVLINALARVAPLVLEGSLRHQGADGPQALGLEELRSMIRDPRYHDPSRRDPSFVARVDKGFQRLFPGSYAGR
jgi:hypothetical protein